MPTPLAILLGLLGGAWGFAADRIAARWPEHEDGAVRRVDWRTPAAVITGALVMGGLVLRFTEPLTAAVFGAYLVALVLLLATDLDQRLLPNVITLPAIPLALGFDLLGLNPLVPPGVLPIAIVVAILVPGLLAALAIPFHADAIGQGDLRLLVSVGLLAGPLRMFSGVVYGAFAAGAVIVILLAMRRITLKSYIPFGPFLIIGAAWALLVIP